MAVNAFFNASRRVAFLCSAKREKKTKHYPTWYASLERLRRYYALFESLFEVCWHAERFYKKQFDPLKNTMNALLLVLAFEVLT